MNDKDLVVIEYKHGEDQVIVNGRRQTTIFITILVAVALGVIGWAGSSLDKKVEDVRARSNNMGTEVALQKQAMDRLVSDFVERSKRIEDLIATRVAIQQKDIDRMLLDFLTLSKRIEDLIIAARISTATAIASRREMSDRIDRTWVNSQELQKLVDKFLRSQYRDKSSEE